MTRRWRTPEWVPTPDEAAAAWLGEPPEADDPEDGGRLAMPGRVVAGALLLCAVLLLAVTVVGLVVLVGAFYEEPEVSSSAPVQELSSETSQPDELPSAGSYVESEVLPSGRIRVRHWINSRVPLTGITVAVPDVPGVAGTGEATGIVVTADGRALSGIGSVATLERSYSFLAAHRVYLTYEMTGAVERSATMSGRALARVTSLDVSYEPQLGPRTVAVEGAEVLALACSPATDPASLSLPCGDAETGGWKVVLRGADRTDRVMAQLDLG